jgi:hypothetical protein
MGTLDPEVLAAIIAGAASLVLAVLTGIAAYVTRKRERRRELYGQAYEVAMAWLEMLYRVRRRAASDEADRALIDRFHQLQERIDYFRGWIGSESSFMARSYCRLVNAVKASVEGPVDAAWKEEERRPAWEGTKDGDEHPDCSKESERFLFDVRWHLSLFGLGRPVVAWRNRRNQGDKK